MGEAERAGGLLEQVRQGVRRGPWEALDPVLDPQASGRGQHGGERVRRLAKRVRAAEDAETRFRVLAQHQRNASIAVSPSNQRQSPPYQSTSGESGPVAAGRTGGAPMGATTMLGAVRSGAARPRADSIPMA